MRDAESSASKESKDMTNEVSDLRVQVERLVFEAKESAISNDTLKEQNNDLNTELEELRRTITELKASQTTLSQDDKEKRKAEKMAQMMAGLDTVRSVADTTMTS